MPYVCRATGHIIDNPPGRYCNIHGAPLIEDCFACGAKWTPRRHPFYEEQVIGSDFCASCGLPAPWASRAQLLDWLCDGLNDAGLDPARRLELAGVLDQLAMMDLDDTRALAAWRALQRHAPKVWELAKPVLSSLIGAGLRKHLGLE